MPDGLHPFAWHPAIYMSVRYHHPAFTSNATGSLSILQGVLQLCSPGRYALFTIPERISGAEERAAIIEWGGRQQLYREASSARHVLRGC